MTDDLKKLAEAAKASSYVAETGEVFYQPHPLAEFRRACTVETILALIRERDEALAELAASRQDNGYIIGWNGGWDEAFSRLRFPTMLRKMWSGGEVQRWLDERKAEQTGPPSGSLSERLAAAEVALSAAQEEVERLRALLERGARPIRWEPSQGRDGDAIRAHARGCETYKHGDVVLLLVNQGDYLMRQIWESEVAATLAKEPPHAG